MLTFNRAPDASTALKEPDAITIRPPRHHDFTPPQLQGGDWHGRAHFDLVPRHLFWWMFQTSCSKTIPSLLQDQYIVLELYL
ncbi:hypothetical protein CEXT_176291 [Caerostris extrusa]|uniref:Uncharacterized protein n=1 Tax=Caerostris extrusa TaxID=172846 RepID=A0AAV4ML92_CAEEX|nr:hypothetical protein CEXT_176291 [Caerostris extrusa]